MNPEYLNPQQAKLSQQGNDVNGGSSQGFISSGMDMKSEIPQLNIEKYDKGPHSIT